MAARISHLAVLYLWQQGWSRSEIAAQLGCSIKSIRRIARAARMPPRAMHTLNGIHLTLIKWGAEQFKEPS